MESIPELETKWELARVRFGVEPAKSSMRRDACCFPHICVPRGPRIDRLSNVGKRVGSRMLELLTLRDKNSRREIKLNSMLLFVNTVVWKSLFGKQADALEKDGDSEDTCGSQGLCSRVWLGEQTA